MKIKIISIGNKPPKEIQRIFLEYTSRISDNFKIELVEIKSENKIKPTKEKKIA